ncbi:sulfur oxidation c-type cytochrome SoxX [Marinovum sp. 2_MG-2023]|uniref:sulfur oxidation c-type cytochrome SoxX n=1 Tax=Roseobacteraceae TaxID=2854170 RepID=UPI001FD36B2B|nr:MULTISPECIES: sulfur oxidation c-type cytochrome SoxX [Roseobacteraceae]MCJ7875044.1 sulfur oxidation c-type cytochrome SoxX [Phaeobacter sp. J2-8]MDO6730636.1 sulfur oxidation c-type cytochrome SoxX [Marinovum sp. 2_MG-2023]MDO6778787.1 sulfur oxidation c-type cytochrome SoxX [Marinovum sp. 1_MG-2023]
MRFMTITLAIAALAVPAAFAGEIAPGDVQYDDYGAISVSLSGAPGDAANGALIMKTKSKGNCISCHAVTELADAPFHGEVGPGLDGVGSRWEEAEIRGIVANAKMTYDGTMMPAFYKTSGYIRPGNAFSGKAGTEPLPPLLTAQDIEDVVAFLMTLQDE